MKNHFHSGSVLLKFVCLCACFLLLVSFYFNTQDKYKNKQDKDNFLYSQNEEPTFETDL